MSEATGSRRRAREQDHRLRSPQSVAGVSDDGEVDQTSGDVVLGERARIYKRRDRKDREPAHPFGEQVIQELAAERRAVQRNMFRHGV
jgi:hypothetical protein